MHACKFLQTSSAPPSSPPACMMQGPSCLRTLALLLPHLAAAAWAASGQVFDHLMHHGSGGSLSALLVWCYPWWLPPPGRPLDLTQSLVIGLIGKLSLRKVAS